MLPYPKVILFDLDDTLISYEGVAEQAWEKCCIDFTNRYRFPFNVVNLLDSINITRKWYWSDPDRHLQGRRDMFAARREIVTLAMHKLNIDDKNISRELADSYSTYREQLIHLFPNTIYTLEKLKTLDIRLGMITNGTNESQRGKLERFDLSKYFEYILVEGELGFGKPDKRIYMMALSLFNVSPQDCWMIGDNLVWDIQAPQSLGMYTIWNDYCKAGLSQNSPIIPNHIISDSSELLTLLTNE